MKAFTTFMDNYFFYIWLVMFISLISLFYFKGRATIRQFGNIDLSKVVYFEKFASGYSNTSLKTRKGGASKVLHIFITDKELIIKTFLFLAYIAKFSDMLHRIPLENVISAEIKKGTFSSKLHVRFTTENGETKEMVLMSKNNNRIKEILDRYISQEK